MKKLSLLMSVLVASLLFVSCEKDDSKPTAKLTFQVEEVAVDAKGVEVELGKTLDVTVIGGEADYTAASSDVEVATVEVEGNTITVTSVVEVEGAEEGGEEVKPATVTVKVQDKNGVKGEFKVTITEPEIEE